MKSENIVKYHLRRLAESNVPRVAQVNKRGDVLFTDRRIAVRIKRALQRTERELYYYDSFGGLIGSNGVFYPGPEKTEKLTDKPKKISAKMTLSTSELKKALTGKGKNVTLNAIGNKLRFENFEDSNKFYEFKNYMASDGIDELMHFKTSYLKQVAHLAHQLRVEEITFYFQGSAVMPIYIEIGRRAVVVLAPIRKGR